MSIITMRSISRKLCVRLFYVCKISTAILRILWHHLQTDLRNVQCVAKNIWSSNRWRKQRSNRCIIGDTILSQTGNKLTKKSGSEFGALLWLHLTPHRKTALQVHNYSSSGAQQPQRYLGKFFWCAQTCFFFPSHFCSTNANFDNAAVSAIASDLQKKIIQVHTYVLGPKLPRLNLIQIS